MMLKENSDKELESHLRHFQPPPVEIVDDLFKPMRFYFSPQFFGMDNVDASKPYLFITNHTVYGLTDGILFGVELYKKKGIFLRPLVDDLLFEIPIWKDKIRQIGFVKASRENCTALMKVKENILVFPGGRRETWKHKGEAYTLIWKDHLGFAKMAIKNDYPILPVAQIGGDEALDIVVDADDIMKSFIGKFLQKSGIVKKYLRRDDIIPPLVRGLFGLWGIPKPVRIYIAFGKPIDTTRFKHDCENEEVLWRLRYEVELAMNKLFIQLIEYRSKDKDTGFLRRLLTK